MRLSPQEFQRISQMSSAEFQYLPPQTQEDYVFDVSEREARMAAAAEERQFQQAIQLSQYEYDELCKKTTRAKIDEVSAQFSEIFRIIQAIPPLLGKIQQAWSALTVEPLESPSFYTGLFGLVLRLNEQQERLKEITAKIIALFEELKKLRDQANKENWHVSNIIQIDKCATHFFKQVVGYHSSSDAYGINEENWHKSFSLLDYSLSGLSNKLIRIKQHLDSLLPRLWHGHIESRQSLLSQVTSLETCSPVSATLLDRMRQGLTPELCSEWAQLHHEQHVMNCVMPNIRSAFSNRIVGLVETLGELQKCMDGDQLLAALNYGITQLLAVETQLAQKLSSLSLESMRDQDARRQSVLTQMSKILVERDFAELERKIEILIWDTEHLFDWSRAHDLAIRQSGEIILNHAGYELRIKNIIEGLSERGIPQALNLLRPFFATQEYLQQRLVQLEAKLNHRLALLQAIPEHIRQVGPRYISCDRAILAYSALDTLYHVESSQLSTYHHGVYADDRSKLNALEKLLATLANGDEQVTLLTFQAKDPVAFSRDVPGCDMYHTHHTEAQVDAILDKRNQQIQQLEEERSLVTEQILQQERDAAWKEAVALHVAQLRAEQEAEAVKRQAELEAKQRAEEAKRQAAQAAREAAQRQAEEEKRKAQEEKAAAKLRAEEEKQKAREEKVAATLKAEKARQRAELHKKIEAGQKFNTSVDAYVQLIGRTGFSPVIAQPTTSSGKKLTVPNVFEATDFDEILDEKDNKSAFGL